MYVTYHPVPSVVTKLPTQYRLYRYKILGLQTTHTFAIWPNVNCLRSVKPKSIKINSLLVLLPLWDMSKVKSYCVIYESFCVHDCMWGDSIIVIYLHVMNHLLLTMPLQVLLENMIRIFKCSHLHNKDSILYSIYKFVFSSIYQKWKIIPAFSITTIAVPR